VGTPWPEAKPEGVKEKIRVKKTIPPAGYRDLWFATLRYEWSTMVVLPASSGASALPVARALAEVGGVDLISAEGVTPSSSSRVTQDMLAYATRGRVIVALDAIVSNPAGLPVVLAADAALLCVTLGETEIASARRTLEMVGRDQFIGCVTIASR
jgi:hypothetical protein